MILRNPNGNRNSLYLYWNDGEWIWNTNWLDNDWNRNNLSALVPASSSVRANLFISLSFLNEGVLFFKLAMPTAEHFADLKKRRRDCNVFFLFDRVYFPRDL